MGEWITTDSNEVADLLSVYYPEGDFAIGIDGEAVFVLPDDMKLPDTVKIIELSIRLNEIPAYIDLLGSPEQVFAWIRDVGKPDDEEGKGDLSDPETVRIALGLPAFVPVPANAADNDDALEKVETEDVSDIEYLLKQVKKKELAFENKKRTREMVERDLLPLMDMLIETFAEHGGDVDKLPEDTIEKAQLIIVFLESKLNK